jgi:hypothetical protein
MKHLEHDKIFNDAQHGLSCESQLILTIQDLVKNTDIKDQTGFILIDPLQDPLLWYQERRPFMDSRFP